jgi:glycosyltransferase involved in cell wall biosynthesis
MQLPIKILHCLGTLNPGGVETWLLNILRHIDAKQLQFDFCVFGDEAGLYAPEIQRFGSKVHRCPRFPSSTLRGRFQEVLREGQYDVVHSHVHFFSGALLRWASMQEVPIRIAHSHSSHDGKPNSFARGAYRKLMRHWIHQYATHGLASSGAAAVDLFTANWKNDHRLAVLHYGIDLQCFRVNVDRQSWRERMKLHASTPVVGHVGNFVAAKNHKLFLEIADGIVKRRPEVHFLMVGDGPLRPQIEMQAQTMGLRENMHFLGARTDVPLLLLSCIDASLFPSLWEGLPVALIEAQAAGLRCVISSEISDEVLVLPEQVIRLPLSMSPEEWAEKMLEVMDLGRLDAKVCTQALENTDFCIEQSLSRLSDLYSGRLVGASAAAN